MGIARFDAKNQPTEIWIDSFFLSVKMPIATFMEETKPVVTEKHLFDLDEVFLITTSWKFWNNMILMQGSVSMIFKSNPTLQK